MSSRCKLCPEPRGTSDSDLHLNMLTPEVLLHELKASDYSLKHHGAHESSVCN